MQTSIQNHASCDAKHCRERVRYEGSADDCWGEPSVPEGWTTYLPLKSGTWFTHCPYHSRPNAKCANGLGERPGWMNVDQWDPCPCDLPIDHEGDCSCTHLRDSE